MIVIVVILGDEVLVGVIYSIVYLRCFYVIK